MTSTGSEQLRTFWVQVPEAQARLIASAALLTALQCRGAGYLALQPLTRSFTNRLAQRCGQQLCCAHGRPSLPTSTASSSSLLANSASPGAASSEAQALHRWSCRASGSGAAQNNTSIHGNASAAVRPANRGSSAASSPSCNGVVQSPQKPSSVFGWSHSATPASRHPATSSSPWVPSTPHLPSTLRPRISAPGTATPSAFRSFAASAVRITPPNPNLSAAATTAAASASAAVAAAARCTRTGWLASQTYLANVRHAVQKSVLESMAPYNWISSSSTMSWGALFKLYKQSYAWLPYASWGLLPGVRRLHFFLLSAINVFANNLPVTLALTVAELYRSSRTSHADAFRFYLEVPPSSPEDQQPWWQALPLQMASLLSSLARSLWLLLLFAPVLLSAPVALQLQFRRAEWIELLRRTLEAAGPAFIKWGQWAATRHDLFPPDMCSELERLHTQAPAHRFRHTQAAIESAFGLPLTQLFAHIDTAPVASGSIGQIHRAVLSEQGGAMTGIPPGTTVAVKVRHPGVDSAILRDFAVMMAVAHLASLLPSLQHLRLEQTLSQFAAPLREQVDLSREAANLRRFNHNFRKTRHVSFPVPLYPLVTPDVLVETYETGEHITSYIQSEHNPYNHRLSELGSGTMLQMMLVDNLIHSDLHPGNILVRLDPPAGLLGLIYSGLDRLRSLPSVAAATRARIELLQQRWLQPSLVLLDVGMATELSPTDQTNMVGLFRSFAAMDGRACGDWTLRFSGASQSCPDPEAFRAAMQATFDELHKMDLAAADAAAAAGQGGGGEGGSSSCAFKNGAEALASVLELVRLHQVSLPGHICAVVVTTLVLEGWSNKLDPDHSVLTQVQAMFEPENVPWSHRIAQLVDRVMQEEGNHFALA
ncbi:hypothetical protein Agub_g324 [Astrephomene gubernaculifera]|uniref:ABC1 atypical kinase-like domain-containing protein n=1 Tax=Astrephomene gubernaculifera TaxID=47775 RepID=A0AAD3HGT1_9CHLO|nr:hypothetical protein Agub_g324 [Astrephomene gubernaculifera]